jgi:CelD/BcsL family acetyltransferase involved in cellulose biosynthesis
MHSEVVGFDERITTDRITGLRALEALRDEWAALYACCRAATPFQSPEWLIPWWRHLGVGDLETLALRRDGELIGVAPLYIYPNTLARSRDVLLVGCGTSDYLDVVCEPGYETQMLHTVLSHLERESARWDRCEFTQLGPGSALLGSELPSGWTELRSEAECCVELALPAGATDLESVLPKRMLRNLRYYHQRASNAGEIRIARACEADVQQCFDNLVRLHASRWAAKGEPGVLASEAVCGAHRDALPDLLASGMLRLYTLTLHDEVIAAFYGFADTHHGGRTYAYLSAFDPRFEDFSPGTLVIAHAIEEAMREGAGSFDFLRGREFYKYLWGATDRATLRRELLFSARGC